MINNEVGVVQFYERQRRQSFSAGIYSGNEVMLPLRWSELPEDTREKYRRQYRRHVLSGGMP